MSPDDTDDTDDTGADPVTDPDSGAGSGAGTGEEANTERSPRRGMCAAVLSLEAVVLGLTTPVMIMVAGVAAPVALGVGLGLAVACLLVAGMLRGEWAYLLGWALQVAAVALGFVVGMMFVLGAVFAALWGTADLLGRKIERERAEAWAAYRAGRATQRDQ